MNILYLKYAIEVAKTGSINKAAETLFVAQPNISRAIKELESQLEITIFDRNSKGMKLTPEGDLLVQYGKKILKQIDEVEDIFKGTKKNNNVFSISVPRASYIAHAFANFTKTLSNEEQCEIYYKETNSQRAIKNVVEDGVHLGIVRFPQKFEKQFKERFDEKKLTYEHITEFNYVLLVSKNSPLLELDQVHYDDLENYIEITHADPYVPSLPLSVVKKEELPDNINRRIYLYERCSQFEVLSSNDETFMWVSPVPEDILKRYNLVQIKCDDNKKLYDDVLIYKNDYVLSELDKTFITELCNSRRKYLR